MLNCKNCRNFNVSYATYFKRDAFAEPWGQSTQCGYGPSQYSDSQGEHNLSTNTGIQAFP